MSAVDFMFEGSAPIPGSTSSTSQVQLPEWYTQYVSDMLGRAQGVANLPYAQYTGPRIAAFTPTEKTGFEMTKAAAGAYEPFLGQAGQALAGAGVTFPEAVSTYMSPYTQNVVNQIAEQGVRQLQEKYLPAVGEEFIKAGQFGPGPGSSRMGEFGARALRDVQEAVLSEQAKALESGYKTAADIFGADVTRKAGLAGTAADVAGMAQKYGLTGAGAVTGVGEKERAMGQANLDLAYQDFLRQQGYPEEQVKFLSGIASSIRLPQTTITQSTDMPAQPGGPSGIEKAITGATGISAILDLLKKYGITESASKGFADEMAKEGINY